MNTPVQVHARRSDYSLTDEQQELRAVFTAFFARECPSTRVRAAEPLGFDDALWQQLVELDVVRMALPTSRGGDGAGLVDLALVTEQQGAALAPVPLPEALTAARLLAAVDAPALDAVRDGSVLAAIALVPQPPGAAQLVPGAAVAGFVVGLDGDDLVQVVPAAPVGSTHNLGAAALGWCDLSAPGSQRTVLASGVRAREAFSTAVEEWKILMSAALVGLARSALELSVQYAKDRCAFDVPIGTFQAVAHPLADVAIAVEGGRRLVWRAAWFLDHDPTNARALVPMAYLHACETANRASTVGIHTQGGFGFTLESDMQLHFRRAKGWALVAGDPLQELVTIADACYGAVGA